MCGEAHLSYYRQRVHASATTAIYILHDERSSFALRDAANSVRGIDRMSSRSLAAPPYYFPGGLTAVVNDSKTAHLASAFFCPNVHTLSFCSAPPRGRGALAHAPPYITKAYKYIYLSNTRGRVQSIQNFAATCRSSGNIIFLNGNIRWPPYVLSKCGAVASTQSGIRGVRAAAARGGSRCAERNVVSAR